MSLDIWPPVSSLELKTQIQETQNRELDWFITEVLAVCTELKHGLEDCYALLAPIEPGTTLVMSTPRNERVKGTITRIGTRIVKGSLNIQLRTVPAQTLTVSSTNPIHIPALDGVFTHLTQSIDLLGIILSEEKPDAAALSSTLSVLAEALSESTALLKGPAGLIDSDPKWQTGSCPAHHFSPAIGPSLSVFVGIQDSCIVLSLRALEEAGAPVNFGLKLGLAIGTVRRLEHDEMDVTFRYDPKGDGSTDLQSSNQRRLPKQPTSAKPANGMDVYVREKVRVESADASLISLFAKLGYLSHSLGQARRNLAAVMGTEYQA